MEILREHRYEVQELNHSCFDTKKRRECDEEESNELKSNELESKEVESIDRITNEPEIEVNVLELSREFQFSEYEVKRLKFMKWNQKIFSGKDWTKVISENL